MKAFKKIIATLTCLTVLLAGAFALAACSGGEIQKRAKRRINFPQAQYLPRSIA